MDLPEISLVAILDASEEGFLRSYTSLIQIAGREARNVNGKVILYAREITKSIEEMVKETNRRRQIQEKYNKENNIIPETIIKDISSELVKISNLDYLDYTAIPKIKPAKDALKEYQPKFNVNLKDDKTYPYLILIDGGKKQLSSRLKHWKN